jgi:hypothetical protein
MSSRFRNLVICLVCRAAILWLATAVAPCLIRAADTASTEDGFEPLFADDALTGWVKEGPAGFSRHGNVIACDGSGEYPNWLRSEAVYENFVLRFDFRLGLYGEGGVFLHAPRYGRNSNVGFEIQLSDDTRNREPATISSGAIFGAVPPREQASRPLKQWNSVEATFDWPRLRVVLNDRLVQDLDVSQDPELRDRLRSGYLGLQDRGKPYELRNLRIKRLANKERWQALFDGSTFSGWNLVQPEGAKWTIEQGEIVARNGNGYLVTEKEWQDFDFQVYVKASPNTNGGVFFRWKTLVPKDRGFEIQIEDIADSNNPTGSIYDLVRARTLPVTPGEWYLLQLHATGSACRVRVNGENVAATERLNLIRAGHISLQMHSSVGTIRFFDPRIKPADGEPTGANAAAR